MQFEVNKFSRKNRFLITYAITFLNFVLSFGSLFLSFTDASQSTQSILSRRAVVSFWRKNVHNTG